MPGIPRRALLVGGLTAVVALAGGARARAAAARPTITVYKSPT